MSTLKQDPAVRSQLRAIVRGGYDLQHHRITTGLRLVATLKVKNGIDPGIKEEDAAASEREAATWLKNVRESMETISDYAAQHPKEGFRPHGVVDDYTTYLLASNYMMLRKQEEFTFNGLTHYLPQFPIYQQFLKDIKGCGPMMSALIISEFDPHKAMYPSSMWKYAGLDVVINPETGLGEGRSRKEHHLADVEYTAKDGTLKTRRSITYNPLIKSKLLAVFGAGILKACIRTEKDADGKPILDENKKKIQKANGKYAQIYINYKHRLTCHPKYKDTTDLHRHNMAMRYMVKIFLIDLYKVWRELEGLVVEPPYHVAKLGMRDHDEAA